MLRSGRRSRSHLCQAFGSGSSRCFAKRRSGLARLLLPPLNGRARRPGRHILLLARASRPRGPRGRPLRRSRSQLRRIVKRRPCCLFAAPMRTGRSLSRRRRRGLLRAALRGSLCSTQLFITASPACGGTPAVPLAAFNGVKASCALKSCGAFLVCYTTLVSPKICP